MLKTARRSYQGFFKQLVLRQIRQDYLQNLTGFAWLFLQPMMLLAVYAFVFSTIFKARIPDSGGVSFAAYLAIAFWPWTAFAEAVLKASGSISAHAGLVSKVAFPRELIPLATVTATFIMHGAGFLAVILVLALTGTPIHWWFLPIAALLFLLLWLFASAITLFTSSLQVFVRDLAQILPPLMTLWFFITPILYSVAMLPPKMAAAMQWNPMTWFTVQFRDLLLYGKLDVALLNPFAWLAIPLFAYAGLRWFRRFSGHFEDFL